MSSLPILELRAVGKSYGANRVLKGIDLAVTRGEIVSLIGPSGSGKTTALRCMNFLEAYDEGEVWIKGQLLGYRSAGRAERDRAFQSGIEHDLAQRFFTSTSDDLQTDLLVAIEFVIHQRLGGA